MGKYIGKSDYNDITNSPCHFMHLRHVYVLYSVGVALIKCRVLLGVWILVAFKPLALNKQH